MNLKDLKEWQQEFKTHPIRAVMFVALAIVIAVCGYWIYKRTADYFNKSAFTNLEGQYEGIAEGNKFKLCLKVFGDKVQGAMVWDDSPALLDYVDYEGKITEKEVDLTYKRNPNHPIPDNGVAVITPAKDGLFGGYWKSDLIPKNRQEWSLRKTSDHCTLPDWKG